MSLLDQLLTALAGKPPDTRADFVGHLAFNLIDDLDTAALPADMRADLDRFIDHVGFEEEDSVEKTRDRIDAHFEAHALDADLLQMFEALEGAIAAGEAASSSELGWAASAVLGSAQSLKPVGADGRKPGAMAGGLLGLVTARAAKRPPSPTPSPPPDAPRSTNPAPPGPNPPFSR
jgi:hypothetical protein